ncbi:MULTISPECIES: YjjI family glycine radical enzyme [unclassified Salinivibrio]|uniref:YjjI family glycine radical enzyme n=1 Tax=unclassified Salinivibrio TaxID=2636825 RepID=UPI000986B8C6|nr:MULTISPECIES: YjjI family glycine radical enzyme [unclassified Salinivibrio]OOF15853.1 YjjI family glycine radical enzyme [Salinivibrio sp. PR919]OOF16150.1 YjjI family glycine radical enzyme [Salinivibrio sp. PR932]
MTDAMHAIVTHPSLTPSQKTLALAAQADAALPYVPCSRALVAAMEQGVIGDMFEGHAPFKPRYVLPDYARFLKRGSEYLALTPATDLEDALMKLMVLYHHVPSVTNIPVFLGYLDQLLLPYCDDVSDEHLYQALKRFWIQLDRTLPDAFMHANIGPDDNRVCRMILRIDAELQQVAPNLTLMVDPSRTPRTLVRQATDNIIACSKPHIANWPVHQATFGDAEAHSPNVGIVSCYNALPIGGGANTLVRLNLKKVAEEANDLSTLLSHTLPHYGALMVELIDARSHFLHQESHFFNSFLVQEGLIDEKKFVPMFGVYAMAEAVNTLMARQGLCGEYGHDAAANEMAHDITKALSTFVAETPVKHGWRGRALLHAQGGLSIDQGTTPGVRIRYGYEPDPVTHLQALAPLHPYFEAGVSEILTLDDTIKGNPDALTDLCLGALQSGLREFTANTDGNDLVRITGYMVKKSEIAQFKQSGSRTNTTVLGAEASEMTTVTARQPRVVSAEFLAGARWTDTHESS